MTELAFEPQCSNCLIFLSINAGHVLSCGDFFCPSCCNLLHEHFQRNICPSCGVKEIQIVQLSNPPNEVLLTLTNPAQSLQTHFDSLKFQILHYKKMLRQSTSLLNKMENERQQLIKKCTELSNQLERGGRTEQGEDHANPPKVFWKSGSNKDESIFLRKGNDETRRTPLPLPSPNKVIGQRPITPNSPQVDYQNIRKHSLVASPKYPHDYVDGKGTSTPKYRSISTGQRPVSSPQPSPRIRSPYLPYIRSSGKVSNPPPH